MEKNCKITLETAKQFYKDGGAAKQFVLDNFTEAELTAVRSRAMSWEELFKLEGEYIENDSKIASYSGVAIPVNRNIFPKGYAKAALALAQLLQLRDNWNDGWMYKYEEGYGIYNNNNRIENTYLTTMGCPLSFKTKELRDEFLEQFRDLITEALPLL